MKAKLLRAKFYINIMIRFGIKSHTWEEWGAQLKYLLDIYWWTWKTNWSGTKKNKIILIFTMLHFFKKQRKTLGNIIILHLCTKNLDDMIYGSWGKEQDGLELVILSYFLPFYNPKNPKIKILKKWKKLLEKSSFYTCIQKS